MIDDVEHAARALRQGSSVGGAPLEAPQVERRLAAILAADVVGYSRLVELDEAGTIARL